MAQPPIGSTLQLIPTSLQADVAANGIIQTAQASQVATVLPKLKTDLHDVGGSCIPAYCIGVMRATITCSMGA